MSTRPRLLLFDLDGVLADYDRSVRCAALARAAGGDATSEACAEALFGADGLEHTSDRGEIGLRGLLDGLRERHGWCVDAADFFHARQLATQARPAMLALCGELAAQARLAVFSNNGDWVAAHVAEVVPELPALFGEAIVCSGQMRQSKPAPAAFRTCLARLGGPAAAQALFVDDNADNVEGARVAGLDALLFTDTPALRGALRARGFDLSGEEHAS
jgi:putative hydrolase of the HAD superfamily